MSCVLTGIVPCVIKGVIVWWLGVLGYERYLVRFPMSYDFTVMLEDSLYSIVNTE